MVILHQRSLSSGKKRLGDAPRLDRSTACGSGRRSQHVIHRTNGEHPGMLLSRCPAALSLRLRQTPSGLTSEKHDTDHRRPGIRHKVGGGSIQSSRRRPNLKFNDNLGQNDYITSMSFTEVLEQLPTLTVEQRQLLIRRALELDEPQMNAADEKLVESRLAALRNAPASAVSLDDMKSRLRSRKVQ